MGTPASHRIMTPPYCDVKVERRDNMLFLWIILSLFVGAIVGLFGVSLCLMAKKNEEQSYSMEYRTLTASSAQAY
jgi:Na+/H+ antiporter NhaA